MPPVPKKKPRQSKTPEVQNFFNPVIKQEIPQYIINSDSKIEKTGGNEYTLKDMWFVPGQIKPLQAGSKFKECNDGWYQVYNEEGVKMWYRVGEKIIKEVFGAEDSATI